MIANFQKQKTMNIIVCDKTDCMNNVEKGTFHVCKLTAVSWDCINNICREYKERKRRVLNATISDGCTCL